jgi:hypothetical protein
VYSGRNSYPPICVDSDVTSLKSEHYTAPLKLVWRFKDFIEGIGINYFIEWPQVRRICFDNLRNCLNYTDGGRLITFTDKLRSVCLWRYLGAQISVFLLGVVALSHGITVV